MSDWSSSINKNVSQESPPLFSDSSLGLNPCPTSPLTGRFTNVNALPSRFLKRSENSTMEPEAKQNVTSSTINDSDLFPEGCSTPRLSFNYSSNQQTDRRDSTCGEKVSSLAKEFASGSSIDFMKLVKNFEDTIGLSDSCFQSSNQNTEEKLMADEMSWNKKYRMPVNRTTETGEFSMNYENGRLSTSTYFMKKSADLCMFKTTPEKAAAEPTPLIDATNTPHDTLSISTIANILSDTSQTPQKALDALLTKKESNAGKGKENVKYASPEPKAGMRSASALSCLPNGKIPIATNRTELNWGCIRPGKQVTQDFIIRNKSESRLWLKCDISNLSFKLVQADLSLSSELKLTLHPFETRKILVTFAPSGGGAYCENLAFASLDGHHEQTERQFIKLIGYGGHGGVVFDGVPKDTSGKMLLSMGKLEEGHRERFFKVRATGTLASFVCFEYITKNSYPFESVAISPEGVVLQPNEERDVRVTYTPKKGEYQFLQNKPAPTGYVFEIGGVNIIHGTEVDRARVRRMCAKLAEKGAEIPPKAHKLMVSIAGEAAIRDFKVLRDSPASINSILQLLAYNDIVLTLELEDTTCNSTGFYQDDTMFVSLCSPDEDVTQMGKRDVCVEPTMILLSPPMKSSDFIILYSADKRRFYYETEAPPGLELSPNKGHVQAGENAMVKIKVKENSVLENGSYTVVFMCDGKSNGFEVEVKILKIR